MTASEATYALEVQTAEEQELVLRQLERILAHPSFRNSQRYRAFLRYVVEERLQGNTLHLKERMIGVAVFHQPLDYDTNANAVVRVTAGEIRRRLAQYYREATDEDAVLIELPIGGYVPEFRPREIAVPEPADHPIDLQRVTFNAALTQPDFPLAIHLPAPRRLSPAQLTLAIVATVLALGLITAAFIFRSTHRPETEADRIWRGAFGTGWTGKDVILCVGPQGWDVTQPNNPSPNSHPDHGISFTSARTAAIIGSAIGHAGGSSSLMPMQSVRLEDLQQAPAVFIGAFNNEWTLRLQSPLRYQFARNADSKDTIVDTKDPSSPPIIEEVPARHGYGILAHFHSPDTGQSTVIAGGLGLHGTAAVRIFLSSPELLRAFAKTAPRGWEERNYEIVLSSDQVNNLADSPKVVHAEFW